MRCVRSGLPASGAPHHPDAGFPQIDRSRAAVAGWHARTKAAEEWSGSGEIEMRPVPLATALLALAAATLLAGPVAAASDWTTFTQKGTRALASNEACADNLDGTVTCSGEAIDVFVGTTRSSGLPTQKGQQVCYHSFTTTFDPATGFGSSHGLHGCTLGGRTVAIDGLRSVTLAPTVIDLTAFECDSVECTESPGSSTAVSGTWTGSGPTVSQKGRSKFDDGTCLQISADNARSRNADFVGSFDSPGAFIGEGTFTFKTNCSF
jgi:hypothetical protein